MAEVLLNLTREDADWLDAVAGFLWERNWSQKSVVDLKSIAAAIREQVPELKRWTIEAATSADGPWLLLDRGATTGRFYNKQRADQIVDTLNAAEPKP